MQEQIGRGMHSMVVFAMSDVALVSVFGVITAVVGIAGSVIVSNTNARTLRLAKQAEWDRQDQMAERAAASARAIVEVNERAVVIGQHNSGQLEVIHTLVNSQMTAAKRAERDAVDVTLTLLREVMELRKSEGQQPNTKTLAAIASTEAKLAELEAELVDRDRMDETARAQAMAQTEAGQAAAVQALAADQQHAAAQLQSDAADKQIAVAEGQAAVAVEQAKVADAQANANTPTTE